MATEQWVFAFWIARFLDFLGLSHLIQDSQSCEETVRARNKKRSGSIPLAGMVSGESTLKRETVSRWTGNPLDAGGVDRLSPLDV